MLILSNDLQLSFPLTVHFQVLFPSLIIINAGNVPQFAAIADNVPGRQIVSVIYIHAGNSSYAFMHSKMITVNKL